MLSISVRFSSVSHKYTHFSAGVAVVLRMTKETGTGVVTESGSECVIGIGIVIVIGNATGMILPVGMVQECIGDAEKAPGAGRGTRNARGNGKSTESTEITEIDTDNLVNLPLISILFHHLILWHISLVGFLSTSPLCFLYSRSQSNTGLSMSHTTPFGLLALVTPIKENYH